MIGLDGVRGTSGAPDQPGGDAGDGEDAVAVAASDDEVNIARAAAGRGGEGGRGGRADQEPVSGAGGAGGAGGDASARALTETGRAATADATAKAGGGGFGGDPGQYSPPASLSGPEGRHGPAGSAEAEAHATSGAGPADASAHADAGGTNGGAAGVSSAAGGSADAFAEARRTAASGSRKHPPLVRAFANAEAGGSGLLLGGEEADLGQVTGGAANAEARAYGRGHAAVSATAWATGGSGGAVEVAPGESVGARGGDAHALAFAEGEGAGAVFAAARSIAGDGGAFLTCCGGGGTGTVSAFGRSLGGGPVEVSAELHAGRGSGANGGADAILVDAAAGETTGALTLHQLALAGNGFPNGAGGNAESHLSVNDVDGGAVTIRSSAWGGEGSGVAGPYSEALPGGDALASAVAHGIGAAPVRVSAHARGGPGGGSGIGPGGDGGSAALGPVFGSSNGGGAVTVIGSIDSGLGGRGMEPGAHPDAVLVNAVDGSTTGALVLAQSAAGWGHSESRLERTHASSSLILASRASGVGATAVADATNPLGAAWALAYAAGRPSSDARAEAYARSEADGAPVLVNGELFLQDFHSPAWLYGARGSPAEVSLGRPDLDGTPGSASSLSVGEHTGDGEVIVFDRAIGGHSVGIPHDGGSAQSEAHASNAGRSLVAAVSEARGGEVGFSDETHGGDAESFAEAIGAGAALAAARAFAGEASSAARTGRALARANASGAKAAAASEASGAGLAARASAAGRAVSVEAAFGPGEAPAGAEPSDAFARVAATPDADALAAALAGSPTVAAAAGGGETLALAALGGGGSPGRLSLGAELELTHALLSGSALGDLALGFLDPALAGKVSLRVLIERDGAKVFRAKVRTADALDDVVVSLGGVPAESLRIAIAMKGKDAASAALGVLVWGSGGAAFASVPEPSTWLPLCVATLGLAAGGGFRPRRRG